MTPFEELYRLMQRDRKRSPWSHANTLEDRYKELASEVEEIREAIEKEDRENLGEELGDALLDILFLMVMGEEQGWFSRDQVIEGAIAKIRRRKPWIFSEEELSIEEEHRRWQEAKRLEKQKRTLSRQE